MCQPATKLKYSMKPLICKYNITPLKKKYSRTFHPSNRKEIIVNLICFKFTDDR